MFKSITDWFVRAITPQEPPLVLTLDEETALRQILAKGRIDPEEHNRLADLVGMPRRPYMTLQGPKVNMTQQADGGFSLHVDGKTLIWFELPYEGMFTPQFVLSRLSNFTLKDIDDVNK
jgi:hypothetical protein